MTFNERGQLGCNQEAGDWRIVMHYANQDWIWPPNRCVRVVAQGPNRSTTEAVRFEIV
jgi:hypothetical protein